MFWRKNDTEDLELDRNLYPHIIWYVQRAQNDKLFKGITRDPLELVRHTEDKCHIWFESNTIDIADVQSLHHPVTAKDACKLAEHLYGGWIMDSWIIVQWMVWKHFSGYDQLVGIRNQKRCMSFLHTKL